MSFFYPYSSKWEATGIEPPSALKEKISGLDWSSKTKVSRQELSFYPDAEFLSIKSDKWQPSNLWIYALKKGEDLFWLNGTSPPFHEFNSGGNLALTEDNVLDYLKMFCFFVRGDEGPFYLIDDLEAPYLPSGLRAGTEPIKGNLSELVKRAGRQLETRYQSPRLFGMSSDDKFRASGTIFYSNAVFVADFLVEKTGMVEMQDDSPVLVDLPVKIDAPLAPLANEKDD